MTPEFAPSDAPTLPLWLIWSGDDLPPEAGDWPAATGFAARAGQICLLPDADGACAVR